MNIEQIAKAFGDAMRVTAEDVSRLVDALQCADVIPETAPTDPRERALWAKRQRGTGPKPEPLRRRRA